MKNVYALSLIYQFVVVYVSVDQKHVISFEALRHKLPAVGHEPNYRLSTTAFIRPLLQLFGMLSSDKMMCRCGS